MPSQQDMWMGGMFVSILLIVGIMMLLFLVFPLRSSSYAICSVVSMVQQNYTFGSGGKEFPRNAQIK